MKASSETGPANDEHQIFQSDQRPRNQHPSENAIAYSPDLAPSLPHALTDFNLTFPDLSPFINIPEQQHAYEDLAATRTGPTVTTRLLADSEPEVPQHYDIAEVNEMRDSSRRVSWAPSMVAATETSQASKPDDTASGPHREKLESPHGPTGVDRRSNDGRWEPFCLRPLFLLGIAALGILLVGALEILNFYSERNQGLTTVKENHYYLWKYGPTSVFTIIAALWGRVEYLTKQVMPWIEMSRGKAKAENSLLINYISPWFGTSLYRSLKLGHYPVFFALLGTLLLQLLVISSTGLLSMEYKTISHNETITVLDKFDIKAGIENTMDTLAASNYWAMKHYDVPLPHGTTGDFATQAFTINSITNETITADVEVFSSELKDCQPLSWTYAENVPALKVTGSGATLHHLDVTSGSCFLRNFSFSADGNGFDTWTGRVERVECSNTDQEADEHRILISVSSVYREEDTLITAVSPVYLKKLHGIICTPTYSLDRRTVSNYTGKFEAEDVLELSGPIDETLPLGISPKNITDNIIASIQSNEALQAVNNPFASNISTWLTLLNETVPQPGIADWANETLLRLASEQIFRSLVPQWAKRGKTAPTNQTVPGYVSQTYPRLCVQPLALRLMEAFLGLLSVGSIAICITCRISLPGNPGSLMVHAMLLARSPGLAKVLEGAGRLPEKAFRNRFIGLKMWCPSSNRRISQFTVNVEQSSNDVDSGQTKNLDDPAYTELESNNQLKLWQPMSGSWVFRIAVITTPLLIVIALETLYQVSAKHSGIADVSMGGYVNYTWVFIPSIVMATIGLVFGMLDTTSRLLSLLQELRKRSVDCKAMQFDPFDRITIFGFFQALQRRSFALSAILMASLIAPFLTIVTSGLYNPEAVPLAQQETVKLLDWFNITNSGRSRWDSTNMGMGLHMAVSDLIQFSNVSYPQWTYDEIVFPKMDFEASEKERFSNKTNQMDVRIPGVRAQMNCTLNTSYKNGHFKSSSKSRTLWDGDTLVFPANVPPACLDGWKGDASKAELYYNPGGTIQGFFADSVTGTMHGSAADPGFCLVDSRQHLWFVVGQQTDNTIDEMALIHCMPYIEVLYVNATLTVPSFQINSSAPPLPDDESSRIFSNATYALTLPSLGTESALRIKNMTLNHTISAFFGALIHGYQGTPVEELSGAGNVTHLIQKMEHLYRQLIAQVLHIHYRAPVPAEPELGSSFNATVMDRDRLRLVQSPISTRILEALLLLMVLCAVVNCALSGSAKVLPKDPGSVAAKLSLLEDSSGLLAKIPEDLELDKDCGKTLEGIFKGDRFRLQWWVGKSGDGLERFGIDVCDSEDAK